MRTLLVSLLLFIACLLSSCRTCTKVNCINFYRVQLSGFNEAELKGACILAGTDSVDLQIAASEDSSYYYVRDFEVSEHSPNIVYSFPAAERTFVLSEFHFENHTCNKCTIGKDLYSQFSGCRVNGVEQRGNIITLEK